MFRWLAALLFLSGCSYETTLLLGPRYSESETHIAVDLTVARKMQGRGVCAYKHNSLLAYGPPFNSQWESTQDMLGCGWRFDGD